MDEPTGAWSRHSATDARASYAQLARLVGLSAPSVQERVRRLERRGIITGYHAEVDLAAAGLAVTALVGVHQTDAAELADVAERSAVTEVEDCFSWPGTTVRGEGARAATSPRSSATIGRLQRVQGVARTRTTVVLSTKWEHRQVPLPAGRADPGPRQDTAPRGRCRRRREHRGGRGARMTLVTIDEILWPPSGSTELRRTNAAPGGRVGCAGPNPADQGRDPPADRRVQDPRRVEHDRCASR